MRDNSIDIIKGLAIILMIAGHCGFLFPWDSYGTRVIFSFHMPLFFIFSGYFVKDSNFKFVKEFKHLCLPYIFFGLLRIIEVNLISFCKEGCFVYESILSFFYGAGWEKEVLGFVIPKNTPLWFLLALFFSKLIYQTFVLKFSDQYQSFIVLLLSVIGYVIGKFVWLPFSICPALVGLFFLHCGKYFRKFQVFELINTNNFIYYLSLGVFLSTPFLNSFSLESLTLPYYTLNLIIPICVTYFLYHFLKDNLNEYSKVGVFLSWCGKYSIAILCIHVLESDASPFIYISNIIGSYIYYDIVLLILRVIFTVLVSWLCLKYIPIFKRMLGM